MRTELLPQRMGSPSVSRKTEPFVAPQWSIELAISINTNVRRIFDAMTFPEYQEAWLRMPGHDLNCHVSATQSSEWFRLDRHSIDGIDISIVGSYKVVRRNKLLFTWRKNGASTSNESLVHVRLRGDFGRSTLHLRHSGLTSTTEYLWHYEMWQTSLSNLAALF
jgi:uncharacterized protein YndB with AHSA1/START domain